MSVIPEGGSHDIQNRLLDPWVVIHYTKGLETTTEAKKMRYAAWMLMSEADYGDYVEERMSYECMCGRGDGCDCDGMEEKARADEAESKRDAEAK